MCTLPPTELSFILHILPPIPFNIFEYIALQPIITLDCGLILDPFCDYCCVYIYIFGTNKFELSLQYTAWPRVAGKREMRVNRRSDPHLLSLSDGARRVVAEEAAYRLRRAADEVAILKRSVFGRRPMCHVFCSPCRCSRQTPRRINGCVYDVHATLGGTFGLAVVLERGGREN